MKAQEREKDYLQRLAFHIEKNGFEVLACLDYKELVKPLIFRDWIGTGGKLGYEPLAKKYDLGVSQVRTICAKFSKGAKN